MRGGDELARAAAEAALRRSYGKLVAFLAARTRDVAAAEDALSEAFAAALEAWPRTGVPDRPEAWLLTAARRKHTDVERRRRIGDRVEADSMKALAEQEPEAPLPDHRLALLFACAHPAIESVARAPLLLQAVLGLGSERIAAAFLTSPRAMAQRLVRAKTKIRDAGIELRIPENEELAARLDVVLDAIYAAFSEGWSDPLGTDTVRRDLGDEAIFLGAMVVELLPREPEALGLLALMLHADARRGARRDGEGRYVPLAEQDPARWNREKIEHAEALLVRASALGSIGRYQLEAAIQSAHVHRRTTGAENWREIALLYDALERVSSSPVVAINRALAVAEADGAAAGIAILDELASDARLKQYQPYWAARAELHARSGATDEALRAYDLAIALELDPSVREFLESRRAALLPLKK